MTPHNSDFSFPTPAPKHAGRAWKSPEKRAADARAAARAAATDNMVADLNLGWLRLAADIARANFASVGGARGVILASVIELTWGYAYWMNPPSPGGPPPVSVPCHVNLAELARDTGYSRSQISNAKNSLITEGVIIRFPDGGLLPSKNYGSFDLLKNRPKLAEWCRKGSNAMMQARTKARRDETTKAANDASEGDTRPGKAPRKCGALPDNRPAQRPENVAHKRPENVAHKRPENAALLPEKPAPCIELDLELEFNSRKNPNAREAVFSQPAGAPQLKTRTPKTLQDLDPPEGYAEYLESLKAAKHSNSADAADAPEYPTEPSPVTNDEPFAAVATDPGQAPNHVPPKVVLLVAKAKRLFGDLGPIPEMFAFAWQSFQDLQAVSEALDSVGRKPAMPYHTYAYFKGAYTNIVARNAALPHGAELNIYGRIIPKTCLPPDAARRFDKADRDHMAARYAELGLLDRGMRQATEEEIAAGEKLRQQVMSGGGLNLTPLKAAPKVTTGEGGAP